MDLLNPIYFFGGSFNMSYKGFDFNLMFQEHRAMIFCSLSPTIKTYTNKSIEFSTIDGCQENRCKISRCSKCKESYDTDLMVQDGSYLRIKQIQVGYNFSKDVVQTLKLKN
jgi:hypothetical protein